MTFEKQSNARGTAVESKSTNHRITVQCILCRSKHVGGQQFVLCSNALFTAKQGDMLILTAFLQWLELKKNYE